MRLYLNQNMFISIITTDKGFSCQVMELVHGMGMYPAKITDDQFDVVSCIVHEGFKECSKYCSTLQEVVNFHLQCLLDLYPKHYSSPETMVFSKEEDDALIAWESN